MGGAGARERTSLLVFCLRSYSQGMADSENERIANPDRVEAEAALELLRANLASTPTIRFLNAVWATRSIQSGNEKAGRRLLLEVPTEASNASIGSELAIHPWELELLINERLALTYDALFLSINMTHWGQIAQFVNLVRDMENKESGFYNQGRDIIDHLFRIASRQFQWQQGFLSRQEIFRSTFVYGQGKAAEYFKSKYGIDVPTFSAVCFAYFAMYVDHPQTQRKTDFSIIGISDDEREVVLSIISRSLRQLRELARESRTNEGEAAFKASVLRQFPLIGIGANESRLCCPLPDLLMSRMTSGLFYDVVGGGGTIRKEIGERFEQYAFMTIDRLSPEISVEREFSYPTKLGERKSSDLLFNAHDAITHLIECKANRLAQATRFGDFDVDRRGYDEMVKGVTQIWRFASDLRRGITNRRIARDAIGGLLTMDSWFVAAPKRQEAILAAAERQTREKFPEVDDVDRIPVAFLYMPEFERALAQGDLPSFFRTFRRLSEEDGRGYSFDIVLKEDGADSENWKNFPFEDELGELLPWWGDLSAMKKTDS